MSNFFCKSKIFMVSFARMILCLVLVIMVWSALGDNALQMPKISQERLTPVVRAVQQSLPWVVNIGTRERRQVKDPYDYFFNQFFGSHYASSSNVGRYYPLGSGVVVDERGLVLTNYHVIQRASAIEVRLWNGKSRMGRLIGFDVHNDLCLLELENNDNVAFQAAPFALADDLILGETVLTIGNPFGLEHSVSSGVLSAVNRSFSEGEVEFRDVLQTDAMVNPGNSGGPLINLDGKLIGINLAIRSDAQGICFAIPLARIELFLSNWMKPCHFGNGYIGLPDGPLMELGYRGVRLPEPLADSPLAKCGLKRGAEVVAVNGQVVRRPIDFARAIYSLKPGDMASFLLSDDKIVNVPVAKMPETMLNTTRTGLVLEELTPALRRAIGLDKLDVEGVIVAEVLSPAFFSTEKQQWRDLIKRGDVITKLAGHSIRTIDDVTAILSQHRSGDVILTEVMLINSAQRTFRQCSFTMILK